MYKIVIFTESIKPDENWLGIIEIAKRAKQIEKIIIIGNCSKLIDYSKHNKVFLVQELSFIKTVYYLNNSDIIFGLPKIFYFFKLFIKKKLYVHVGPGRITKAIGIYKNPKKGVVKKIIGFIKYLNPKVCYIAENFNDAMYIATAYGRDISFYAPIGLPKIFFINNELLKNKTKKVGILFAPTHRWEGKTSTISNWLKKDRFIKKLKDNNFSIYYNNHPQEKDDMVNKNVIKTRGMEGYVWKHINIVVTDYSSIGNDFISAGGAKVISIIDDFAEFEEVEGKSPLNFGDIFPDRTCVDQKSFFNIINDIKSYEPKKINIKKISYDWFQDLIQRIDKS